MSDDTRTHFVYTAWDAAGRPLYIGCSKAPVARQRQHRAWHAEWLQYVARYSMTGPYPRDVALGIERERIVTIRPHFNWQPEYTGILRARKRREYELTGHVTEADLDTFDFDAAEDILNAEFDIRVTSQGRHRAYVQHVASEMAAA